MDQLFGLASVLADQMQSSLADRGLTLSRATLLWQLRAGGPAIQRELSHALGVVPRTVTGIVDDLVAAGLVSRSAHPVDRRASVVDLTEAGLDCVEAMRAERTAFAELLFGDIQRADIGTFAAVLGVLLDRLRPPVAARATAPGAS